MADISPEELKRLMDLLGETTEDAIVTQKDLDRSLARFNKTLKDTQPASKQFKDFMNGVQKPLKDVTEELEQYDRAIQQARAAQDTLTEINLTAEKSMMQHRNAVQNATLGARNFAIGTGTAAKTMLGGALDFVKGLQGTREGTELVSEYMEKTAKAGGEIAEAVGTVMQSVGPLLALIRPLRTVGLVMTGLGAGAEVAGPALSKLASEGLKILGEEVEKTKKTFRDAATAGAIFAGGMTELRQISTTAGLNVEQLGVIIKASSSDLSNMGMGMSSAVRRFAGINKELRNSDLGIQLRKLGLNAEEQGELAIKTAAMLQTSGRLRYMSDKQVAETTVEYGKSLKILQNITGEDAAKKMEEARMLSMEADLYAEAMAKGGPKAVERLAATLAATPAEFKKGALEYFSSSGTAIADAATNVMVTQTPKLMDMYQGMYSFLSDNSKTAEEVTIATGSLLEQVGKQAIENRDMFKPIAIGARFTGDALLQGTTEMYNAAIRSGTRLTEGMTGQVADEVNRSAKNRKSLDENIAAVDENIQTFKARLGKELTPALSSYTSSMLTAGDAAANFANKLNSVSEYLGGRPQTMGEKVGTTVGGVGGSIAGASLGGIVAGRVLGGLLGSFAGPAGTVLGATAGGYAGAKLGDWLGGQFADGGIANSPSIFAEAGPEAAVPLPDGRTIPVTMKTDNNNANLANAIKDSVAQAMIPQTQALTEILSTLRDGNNISTGILNNSY